MKTIVISITDTGSRFLVDEDTAPFLTEGAVIRRASHVEPVAILWRVLFHLLRAIWGEKGRMANFTRQWHCLWRVNLKPSGGPILKRKDVGRGYTLPCGYSTREWVATWHNRQDAINAEIEYLNNNFI